MIIDPDRKPKTTQSAAYRRYLNQQRREKRKKLTKAQRKTKRERLIAPAGHVTATLRKRARLERLKARGNIRTPHTRALWAAYYRGDLVERGALCIT